MASKGEQTRQTILEQAAQVFSVRGYFGTSLDDLMQATNLTKGGIYNHFGSKEALALEAFTYAIQRTQQRFVELLPAENNTRNRLITVIRAFQSLLDDPILIGGCPLLNTAVEADDTNLPLLKHAQQSAQDWHNFITRTLYKGMELGDVRPEIDPDAAASLLIAALEGGIMLAKLHRDFAHMQRVADQLTHYVDSLLIAQRS